MFGGLETHPTAFLYFFRLPEKVKSNAFGVVWWAGKPTLRRFCIFSGSLKMC
ncbi:MAG: hypothetical protein IKZ88_00865 [Neisseriaceae bacterium]|nr:hypothetical protein [Neisseriaceae bacterium]